MARRRRQQQSNEGRQPQREVAAFDSSWLERGWYDAEHRQLELEFNDGVHVLYEGVTEFEWDDLKKASSPGRYVRMVIERHPFRVR